MRVIKITALLPIINPVNGILSAWRIPPNAASLKAHNAVILSIVTLFIFEVSICPLINNYLY